jgi:integrase/recombinase XerD
LLFEYLDELSNIKALTLKLSNANIEELWPKIAKPSIKRHLPAIRQLFDYLGTEGILLSTPAGSVRGPKYVVTRGKTSVLSGDEMRQLVNSIDACELIGLRDCALLRLMGYTFARVITLRVVDYFSRIASPGPGFMRKAANGMRCPAVTASTNIWIAGIAAADIGDDNKGPLFRSFKKGDRLTGQSDDVQ